MAHQNRKFLDDTNFIGRALMRVHKKNNRQKRRASIHLPFYERVQARRGSAQSMSDQDSVEPVVRYNGLALQEKITLPEEIVQKCKDAFAKFDLNGDGTIDQDELKSALVSMGYHPTDQEVKEIMSDVDQNGDNALDLLEFLRVIQRQKNRDDMLSEKEKNEINIRECFKILSDDTGKIRIKNFRMALKQFNLALDVDGLADDLDTDRSGFVDFDEFQQLFTEAQEKKKEK